MVNNQKGFSLIEVIASIVIISIVLLSFFQLFVQSNKTAVANNEKLVVINLADAQLERLKLDHTVLTDLEKLDSKVLNKKIKNFNLEPIILNNKFYSVKVLATVSEAEENLKIVNIVVTVTAPNGKTKSSVEGYVKL